MLEAGLVCQEPGALFSACSYSSDHDLSWIRSLSEGVVVSSGSEQCDMVRSLSNTVLLMSSAAAEPLTLSVETSLGMFFLVAVSFRSVAGNGFVTLCSLQKHLCKCSEVLPLIP